jgi:pyrimidine-nucleoside phosphorylase
MGAQVKQGDPLMMIHYNDHSNLDEALEYLRVAYRLAPKRPAFTDLVTDRIA